MQINRDLFVSQEHGLRGVPGVYVASFAHHAEELLSGKAAPVKVGYSMNVRGRLTATDRSFIPSPMIAFRIFQWAPEVWGSIKTDQDYDRHLLELEQHIHSHLWANGGGSPYRDASFWCGTEWFHTTLDTIDKSHSDETRTYSDIHIAYKLENELREPVPAPDSPEPPPSAEPVAVAAPPKLKPYTLHMDPNMMYLLRGRALVERTNVSRLLHSILEREFPDWQSDEAAS